MRNFRMGIVALVSAIALFVGGTAWAASYETIFTSASFDGEQFNASIISEREEVKGDDKCTARRLVEVYQKKDGGGKRELGQKRTNSEGDIFGHLLDRQPKEELGTIFAKATKHEINDNQICSPVVTEVTIV